MKRILLLMILSCFTAVGFAQTLGDGDYRTAKTSGNWSDSDMWETRNAGVWSVTATSPNAANNVYVQAGHTITVDLANAYCKDLQLSTTGSLAIGSNVVNVSGKIRAFSNPAVVGVADGVYTTSSTSLAAAMIVTSGSGLLRFVGGTRIVTSAGEWNSSGTTNNAEFALDANAVGTFVTGFKFKNIEIVSGTVASDGFISPLDTYLTIKTGAKLLITRTTLIIANNSSTKTGTLTIEDGATLELSGNSPTIAVTDFVNNGTVAYSRAGSQNFLAPGGDATATTNIHNYKTLELSGSNSKNLVAPITVSQLLKISGTASIVPTLANTLTMLNNSTIERNGTASTPIPSAANLVFYGTTTTDLVNVRISNMVNHSNELQSAPTPGKVGTLTIDAGVNYTITAGRTVTNVVNNGIIILTPPTTFTFIVNGGFSGLGTISGNANASLTVGGNDGDAGILRFTGGSENLNRLTINRTGTTPSVTLGSSLILNENLVLTNGILNIQPGSAIAMSAANSLAGSSTNYINTQTSGASVGKFVITGVSASKLIHIGHNGNYLPITLTPTTASNFDINVFAGATANATPNGTALTAAQKLRMVDATWNINRTSGTGNVDVTLGWDNTLEGADFSGFGDAQIGIAAYASGTYGAFAGSGNAAANTATLTTSTFAPFVVGEANTTLPLTLLNFTAKESLNSVKLAWQTTDEVNLKKYVLQHKTSDGFKDIYTVAANNKVGVFNYNYTHLNPIAGANYYRLVGVDLDGTTHPNDVKVVNVTLANAVAVYPNPVVKSVVSISGAVNGDIIRILNIQGQVIATQKANGNQIQEINVQNIQAGTYILSVENAGKVTSTKKLIKI